MMCNSRVRAIHKVCMTSFETKSMCCWLLMLNEDMERSVNFHFLRRHGCEFGSRKLLKLSWFKETTDTETAVFCDPKHSVFITLLRISVFFFT